LASPSESRLTQIHPHQTSARRLTRSDERPHSSDGKAVRYDHVGAKRTATINVPTDSRQDEERVRFQREPSTANAAIGNGINQIGTRDEVSTGSWPNRVDTYIIAAMSRNKILVHIRARAGTQSKQRFGGCLISGAMLNSVVRDVR
jgi:hypothetical protein